MNDLDLPPCILNEKMARYHLERKNFVYVSPVLALFCDYSREDFAEFFS